ncbi:hypothetical protein R6Q59_011882 [Mikania micrantha]
MGGSQTKCCEINCRKVNMLREKTRILQQKLDEMICLRETESQVHGQEIMVHALTESEWKQQRKLLQRELKMLNKVQAEWKRMYLAVKIELDNIINTASTTHQGGCWREDELRREARAKDETIQLLQAHIASIRLQQSRREREDDILRQSLRIITHNKKKPNLLHH